MAEDKAAGARGPVARLTARLVPDALFPDSADELRHGRLVALFSIFTFAVAVPLTVVQALFGSPLVMAVASCGVLPLLVIAVLRRTRSVALAANILVGLWAAALAAVTVLRGGYGAPIVTVFAVVPMLALALAGRRSGTVWLVLTLAILCGVGVLQYTVDLPRAPLADPVATNWPGHMLFVVGTYVLMGVYVRLRERAMQDQQAAEEQLWESERRRLASETEAQLLRSSRMAELGTLAAGVAHEINNPLCYIQNNLDYLRRTGAVVDHDEVEQIYDDISTGARRIARIVRDIGTFSRTEEDEEIEALDVCEVVDSSVNLLRNQFRHRATLRRDYEEVPSVAASASRLGQVMVNVLTNALQAVPEGGADQGQIEIRVRPGPGSTVEVQVEDNGGGVPEEVRRRVFEPFFTTKPVGEGTGLGLSICYGIVSKLGGQIRLDSAEGGGTAVTIVLPEAGPEMRRAEPAAQEQPDREQPAVRVLIVDDDRLVAKSTARMLEHHEVTVVTSGRDALAALERGASFDVVLCDLMMPDMTGMDLHAELERMRPEILPRFVFVTGGAFTPRAREFLRRTGNPCLAKPLESDLLEQAVRGAAG